MKRAFLVAAIVSLFTANIYACNRGGYVSGGCGGFVSGGCGSGGCGSGGCQPRYYSQPMYQQCQPMYQPSVQRFRPMNQGCPNGDCSIRVTQPQPIQPQPIETQKTYNKKQVEMPSIREFFE